MATKLALFKAFNTPGLTTYPAQMDGNATDVETSVNQLVDEVRAIQGPNAQVGLVSIQLNDLAETPQADGRIGQHSLRVTRDDATDLNLSAGQAIILGQFVQSVSAFTLTKLIGDPTDTIWIAVDVNGTPSLETAAGQKSLDIATFDWITAVGWTVGSVADGNDAADGTAEIFMDGDDWLDLRNRPANGPFSATRFQVPGDRIKDVELLLSGKDGAGGAFGPLVLPNGTAAALKTKVSDGAGGTRNVGIHSSAADTLNLATAGADRVLLDPQGFVDFPTQGRVVSSRVANQSIADVTATDVAWDTATEDVGGFDDIGGGSPERWTVPTGGDGVYMFGAVVAYQETGSRVGNRSAAIQVNGTTITGGNVPPTTGTGSISTVVPTGVFMLSLVATDFVTVECFHDQGAARNITARGFMVKVA